MLLDALKWPPFKKATTRHYVLVLYPKTVGRQQLWAAIGISHEKNYWRVAIPDSISTAFSPLGLLNPDTGTSYLQIDGIADPGKIIANSMQNRIYQLIDLSTPNFFTFRGYDGTTTEVIGADRHSYLCINEHKKLVDTLFKAVNTGQSK